MTPVETPAEQGLKAKEAAFPNTGNSNWEMNPAPGMSLRDWFAGQALSGLTSNTKWLETVNLKTDLPCTIAANAAYEFADAMLAARVQP